MDNPLEMADIRSKRGNLGAKMDFPKKHGPAPKNWAQSAEMVFGRCWGGFSHRETKSACGGSTSQPQAFSSQFLN
jgi:hypothetical protein